MKKIDNLSNKKFSLQLSDENKKCIKYYDKDTKRGIHVHHCKNGEKIKEKITFTGSIQQIAEDIVNTIEN